MVKKRLSPRKKTIKKANNSRSTRLARRVVAAATGIAAGAAVATATELAISKGKQMYDNRKTQTVKANQPSIYDNIMSFFGFNKTPSGPVVYTCKAELDKLKEELNNAKKSGAVTDNCKNELTKISNELLNCKNDLDNYKKYETVIENHVKNLENENRQLKIKYDNCKAELITQDRVVNVLKERLQK